MMLDTRIDKHDDYRFEIKTSFDSSNVKDLTIEHYFFLPSSLNINYTTYNKDMFYASMQRHIRFAIPDMDIKDLFSLDNNFSPYSRIMNYLENKTITSFHIDSIIDELKLLGSIVKEYISKKYSEFEKSPSEDYTEKIIYEFNSIFENLKDLKEKINKVENNKLKEGFKLTNEYLNILIIETLTDMLYSIENSSLINNTGLLDLIKKEIIKFYDYARIEKYELIDDNKFFLYYRGLLKKFISSCLFLKVEPSEFNIYYHVSSGLASALAMLFAVLVTIYSQSKYSINSAIFVLIAVISYVFKDRIKEFVKIAFSKKIGGSVYDRKINIKEPAHERTIGYVKETFSILTPEGISSDVINIRNIDNLSLLDEDAKIEVILKYKKLLHIDREKIKKYHHRRKNLVDIIRFSIQDFIKHTDNDEIEYKILKDGKIKFLKFKRTYHMNLIVKYYLDKNSVFFQRYRIVFNRHGIVSIDKVYGE